MGRQYSRRGGPARSLPGARSPCRSPPFAPRLPDDAPPETCSRRERFAVPGRCGRARVFKSRRRCRRLSLRFGGARRAGGRPRRCAAVASVDDDSAGSGKSRSEVGGRRCAQGSFGRFATAGRHQPPVSRQRLARRPSHLRAGPRGPVGIRGSADERMAGFQADLGAHSPTNARAMGRWVMPSSTCSRALELAAQCCLDLAMEILALGRSAKRPITYVHGTRYRSSA